MRLSLIVLILCLTLMPISLVFYKDKKFSIDIYNKYRIIILDGGGDKCLKELAQTETVFKSLGNQGTNNCPVKNMCISKFKYTTHPPQ